MAKGRKTGGNAWNFRDLTGQKFNRLLAVSLNRVDMQSQDVHGRTYWNCVCDCGKERVVESYNLTSGQVKSCGCLRKEMIHYKMFKDMTGMRFNKLLVESISHVSDGKYYWNCICDCGNKKIVAGLKLRNGNTQSCGCLRMANRMKPYGEASFNQVWSRYITNAGIRGFEFKLSIEEFKILISQNCYYCGLEPRQIIKSECDNGDLIYNGIDRIDSSGDYEIDNVVPCCGTCNRNKMDMQKEDFLTWIERVYNHSIKK